MEPWCNTSDVWKYEFMFSLLSFTDVQHDADGAYKSSNTNVISNVVHTCISNHVHLFAVKSPSFPNTLFSL